MSRGRKVKRSDDRLVAEAPAVDSFGRGGGVAFTDYRLANGLRVILHQDRSAPLVTVNLLYRVGSKDEEPGRTGFAHLFEHLMFDGSRNVERGGYDRYCTMVGGDNNAFTSSDVTDYHISVPSDQLALALWLESDRMAEFAIQQVSLDTQKNVVIEEKRQTQDDVPYGDAGPVMREISYLPPHPYQWDVIGSAEDVAAATMEDVRTFFGRYYAPARAILVIAGDFEESEARELVERYFGDIPSGNAPSLTVPPVELLRRGERRAIESAIVPFDAVFLGWHAPRIGDRDLYALDLLTAILADGESSRLYQKLEYDLEIASESDAFIDDGLVGSILYIYGVAQNRDVTPAELEGAIREEIERMLREGVSEREMEKARNRKVTRIVHALQSVSNRAERLAWFAAAFDTPELAFREADLYNELTLEDVNRAARRWLGAEPNVVEYRRG